MRTGAAQQAGIDISLHRADAGALCAGCLSDQGEGLAQTPNVIKAIKPVSGRA
jgi:hypothetical protein